MEWYDIFVAILFVISLPFTAGPVWGMALVFGTPMIFISGIISSFIAMFIIAPFKKYMDKH